ncbi:MAG: hypothetical protein QG657_4740 [Acidobacteriota bacterium]|nr:hypothetical protein [Acidobacteriota bacterium]
MKKQKTELLKRNSKIDQKVISAAKILQDKLSGVIKPKQGSDYRISPPLGGDMLMLRLRDKVSNNNI